MARHSSIRGQAVAQGKPDQAFFEQALRELQVSAQEALMVGDDIENDVEGVQPEAILPSIAGLPEYLSRLSQ
ncbi:MAG: HAD hydrolase-like protein [Ktedonobacteraceae bacterium]|nr:HAD hydrolase-like protein [Ktedonobacteraceae bacterium]